MQRSDDLPAGPCPPVRKHGTISLKLLRIADVRTAVVKGGGKMADSGSVLFNFQRQGEVYVKGDASTEEEVTLLLRLQRWKLILEACQNVAVWAPGPSVVERSDLAGHGCGNGCRRRRCAASYRG